MICFGGGIFRSNENESHSLLKGNANDCYNLFGYFLLISPPPHQFNSPQLSGQVKLLLN